MTGANLVAEYRAALRSTQLDDLHPLLAAGISPETIAAVVPASTRIAVAGSTYQPDPDGGSAYLLPVRVDNPLSPEAGDPSETVRAGPIVDLLAMHPAQPGRWALRCDAAEWLGTIEPQYLDPSPVPVWRSPLAWLRADCRGLVLLSRDRRDQYRILAGCLGGILAEDPRHAMELRRVLEHSWPAPRVFVREARRVA